MNMNCGLLRTIVRVGERERACCLSQVLSRPITDDGAAAVHRMNENHIVVPYCAQMNVK
jgi:hypothetical protein